MMGIGISALSKTSLTIEFLCRRKLALLWEVRLLCRNAQTYNEEDSLIVEHARILTETLWKFIKYAN